MARLSISVIGTAPDDRFKPLDHSLCESLKIEGHRREGRGEKLLQLSLVTSIACLVTTAVVLFVSVKFKGKKRHDSTAKYNPDIAQLKKGKGGSGAGEGDNIMSSIVRGSRSTENEPGRYTAVL